MKRLRKRFAICCLTAAALLAVTLGAGLPHIQRYCTDVVARLFPVTYQITYRGGAHVQSITAPVRFTADNAIVTAAAGDMPDTVIPLSDAVFVCLQNELRAQNMLRSGLLTAATVLAAALFPVALSAVAFAVAPTRIRSSAKGRMQATSHRSSARVQRAPTVPSVA